MAALDMRSLAKAGAIARTQELRDELAALSAFVGIDAAGGGGPQPGPVATGGRVANRRRKRGRKRGSTMTPAQRAAVSARMKKYWAGRRAGKSAKAVPPADGAKKRTMSPAARRKIGAAQKRRWAALKRAKAASG